MTKSNPSAAETVAVDLGARSYEVRIGGGLIARAGAEIAPLLQVTVRQLQRDWQRARIWLIDEMLDTDEG